MRHILCAVDGSEPALRAVTLGAQIAKVMGARLTILSVRSFHMDRTAAAGIPTPEETTLHLSKAAAVAVQAGFEGAQTVQISARDAAVAIADYAVAQDVSLIVAGSTGKDAIRRLALGSTSTDLLRKSTCPVTIVH